MIIFLSIYFKVGFNTCQFRHIGDLSVGELSPRPSIVTQNAEDSQNLSDTGPIFEFQKNVTIASSAAQNAEESQNLKNTSKIRLTDLLVNFSFVLITS